jgi:hypothetical protein
LNLLDSKWPNFREQFGLSNDISPTKLANALNYGKNDPGIEMAVFPPLLFDVKLASIQAEKQIEIIHLFTFWHLLLSFQCLHHGGTAFRWNTAILEHIFEHEMIRTPTMMIVMMMSPMAMLGGFGIGFVGKANERKKQWQNNE